MSVDEKTTIKLENNGLFVPNIGMDHRVLDSNLSLLAEEEPAVPNWDLVPALRTYLPT